jgi:UDP-glucose-4-epimerase GalE
LAHLLVAGGAGYIGSHTLRALRRAGHTAVVVDDLRAGREAATMGAPLVVCDVGDPIEVPRLLARYGPFDGVLHFAASIQVAESVARPLAYYQNNVAAAMNLIDAALPHGVRAFVLSSTAAVYGHPDQQPIPEDAGIAPINPYGASKAMTEQILADSESAHGLRWAALRYFNACGADPEGGLGECHDPETHLIPVALEAAAGLRPALKLFGTDYPTPDGTCVRDYIHVSDLAVAHVSAVEGLLAGKPGGPYNLGSGVGHSNREVLDAVGRVVGLPVPLEDAPRRPGDPPTLIADASRFRGDFGWTPRHSDLDTIVATAWEWLRLWRGL